MHGLKETRRTVPPANRTGAILRDAITEFLELYTLTSPEQAVMRFTYEEVDSVPKLYAKVGPCPCAASKPHLSVYTPLCYRTAPPIAQWMANNGWTDGTAPVGPGTFKSIIKQYVGGLQLNLHGIVHDHSKCHTCKEHELYIDVCERSSKQHRADLPASHPHSHSASKPARQPSNHAAS